MNRRDFFRSAAIGAGAAIAAKALPEQQKPWWLRQYEFGEPKEFQNVKVLGTDRVKIGTLPKVYIKLNGGEAEGGFDGYNPVTVPAQTTIHSIEVITANGSTFSMDIG